MISGYLRCIPYLRDIGVFGDFCTSICLDVTALALALAEAATQWQWRPAPGYHQRRLSLQLASISAAPSEVVSTGRCCSCSCASTDSWPSTPGSRHLFNPRPELSINFKRKLKPDLFRYPTGVPVFTVNPSSPFKCPPKLSSRSRGQDGRDLVTVLPFWASRIVRGFGFTVIFLFLLVLLALCVKVQCKKPSHFCIGKEKILSDRMRASV